MTTLVINAGVDHADVIGVLLKQIGQGGPFYRYAKELTGETLDEPRHYPVPSDWLAEAKDVAREIGRRLVQTKSGVWRIVDPDVWNAELDEDRQLAHQLAAMMGELHVNNLLAQLSREEWDEWKDWLRKRNSPFITSSERDD